MTLFPTVETLVLRRRRLLLFRLRCLLFGRFGGDDVGSGYRGFQTFPSFGLYNPCANRVWGELLWLDVVQKVVLDGLVRGGRGESEEEDCGILPIGEVEVVKGAA